MVVLIVVIALYVASAVLPITGLVRIALGAYAGLKDVEQVQEAHRQTRGPLIAVSGPGGTHTISAADFVTANRGAAQRPLREWSKVRSDLWLIGGGIICGTAAGIWSLFL